MTQILVIEDEAAVLENVVEMLELNDFKTLTATNGAIGVQVATEHLPDLILCDIMMPELDGHGVLKKLRSKPETANIPFIFLTAKSTRQDYREGMTIGADDYLSKPFTLQELIEAVNSRLEKQARLMGEINRRTQEMEILRRVDRELSSRLDTAWVVRIVMDWVLRETKAQSAILGIIEPDGSTLKLHYARSQQPDPRYKQNAIWTIDGLVRLTVHSMQPILLGDIKPTDKPSAPSPNSTSILIVPLTIRDQVLGVISLESKKANAFTQNDLIFLAQMANRTAVAFQHAKLFQELTAQQHQELELRKMFGRFVSQEVAEALQSGHLKLEGETRVVSILFCDIRSFTAYSEQHTPQEVVALLNKYLPLVVNATRQNGGMVNQFSGDGTMVIFGAPAALEENAYHAVLTALQIRTELEQLNADLSERGLNPVRIGIGINTGEVVAGAIGSAERQEYTVIGDTVNLASRIESLNKTYPAHDILISNYTYERIGERRSELRFKDLGTMSIRGKTEHVRVWSVLGFA